jgi:hypothetical protein
MSSTDPDQIRSDIERTRAELSHNVNTLADSVNPSSVAKRQTDKVKGAVSGARDKVMGAASNATSGASSAQSTLTDAVSGAPSQARAKTTGNPLAAGLIAFGVGWLTASLMPASNAEQQAAGKIKEAATPILTDSAKDVASNLKEPAQQALTSVKDTATDAASTVKDEGTTAAQDLKDQTQDAKQAVTQ